MLLLVPSTSMPSAGERPASDVALEAGRHAHRQVAGAGAQQVPPARRRRGRRGPGTKTSDAGKASRRAAAQRGAVLVQDADAHVAQVVVQGVGQHQQLDDRQHEHQPQQGRCRGAAAGTPCARGRRSALTASLQSEAEAADRERPAAPPPSTARTAVCSGNQLWPLSMIPRRTTRKWVAGNRRQTTCSGRGHAGDREHEARQDHRRQHGDHQRGHHRHAQARRRAPRSAARAPAR